MSSRFVKKASGETFELPMFDPVVASHVAAASSHVDVLLSEINDKEIYAPVFKGKKDLVFLDIGANIGLVSIYASDSCSKIVAVEPAPETFVVLKAICLKFPQIECVNAALAPSDGPTEFFVNDQNTTASSTVNTYGLIHNVQGRSLRSLLSIYQLEHVDVVKCDIEGGEGDALTFEELEHAEPAVDTYVIEFHNCPASTWNHKMGVVIGYLSKLGYVTETDGMRLTAIKQK